MKFTLNITQDLIDEGERENIEACAFALAYRQLIPDAIVTNTSVAIVSSSSKRAMCGIILCAPKYEWPLTEEQKNFIQTFDLDKKLVKPTSFEVEIPDEVINSLYSDHVEVVKRLANSEVLVLA